MHFWMVGEVCVGWEEFHQPPHRMYWHILSCTQGPLTVEVPEVDKYLKHVASYLKQLIIPFLNFVWAPHNLS